MLKVGVAEFNPRTQSEKPARVKLWKNVNSARLNRNGCSAREAMKMWPWCSMKSQRQEESHWWVVSWVPLHVAKEVC